MLALRSILVAVAVGSLLYAAGVLLFDLFFVVRYRRLAALGQTPTSEPRPVRWKTAVSAAALAGVPLLVAASIVVVPSGMAGVRVSQTSGVKHGTLYPGIHFVKPLVEDVALFDTRDQVFTAGSVEPAAA